VKKTGNKVTYFAKGIENIALSIGSATPVFAIRKDALFTIPELLEYNELEIIYANIRV
jgi:hypothetical protein